MPQVDFSLDSEFAGFELFAHMHWPANPAARVEFLVTTAAQIMQQVENGLPGQLLEAVEALLRRQGIPIEDVLPPGDRDGEEWRFAAIAKALNQSVEHKLLRSNGGHGALADAPGSNAVLQSARDNGRKYGAACGEMLVYVASMRLHHPDLSPSLNRATFLMEQRAAKEGRAIPAERDRKTMWTAWRGVAPLWAAMALIETRDKSEGIRPRSLHDISMREDLLAASGWLVEFAQGFTSRGSRTALLPPDEGLTFGCEVPANKPDIPPLTDEQVRWAAEYRAPQPAQ